MHSFYLYRQFWDYKPISPFFSNALFFYPLKTSEKRKVFRYFQGVEKGCIGNEWVKKHSDIRIVTRSICGRSIRRRSSSVQVHVITNFRRAIHFVDLHIFSHCRIFFFFFNLSKVSKSCKFSELLSWFSRPRDHTEDFWGGVAFNPLTPGDH